MKEPTIQRNTDGGGVFHGIAEHIKLVWRLWLDQRVSPLLKLLPFGSLIYFVSPFDFPGPLDDIGVVWFFTYLFIELSPVDVVAEHREDIQRTVEGDWQNVDESKIDKEDIVDVEFEEQD